MGRADTRERIVGAASSALYRHGINATNVDALASAAGVTKVTLYRHYRSKDALLVDGLRRRHRERHETLTDLLADESVAPRERLLCVFDWLGDWFAEEPFRGCAFVQALVEVGRDSDGVRLIAAEHKRAFAAALGGAAERAGAAKPTELAAQLQLLVEGATVVAYATGRLEAALDARAAAETLLTAHGLA